MPPGHERNAAGPEILLVEQLDMRGQEESQEMMPAYLPYERASQATSIRPASGRTDPMEQPSVWYQCGWPLSELSSSYHVRDLAGGRVQIAVVARREYIGTRDRSLVVVCLGFG